MKETRAMKTKSAKPENKSTATIPRQTHIDLTAEKRVKICALMNGRLADAIDLEAQMKQAHWNVKGPNFIGLHELFDKIYASVEDYVDLIAERIVQLGGIAQGTVRISASRSKLKEYPHTISESVDHVNAVVEALSTFGREVRASI